MGQQVTFNPRRTKLFWYHLYLKFTAVLCYVECICLLFQYSLDISACSLCTFYQCPLDYLIKSVLYQFSIQCKLTVFHMNENSTVEWCYLWIWIQCMVSEIWMVFVWNIEILLCKFINLKDLLHFQCRISHYNCDCLDKCKK